jgi:hypothetical protein
VLQTHVVIRVANPYCRREAANFNRGFKLVHILSAYLNSKTQVIKKVKKIYTVEEIIRCLLREG